jgi:hypothetical protein
VVGQVPSTYVVTASLLRVVFKKEEDIFMEPPRAVRARAAAATSTARTVLNLQEAAYTKIMGVLKNDFKDLDLDE